jgi:hypothetical protein
VIPISERMPVKGFMKLLEALHVNENSLAPKHDDPESDKL